MSGILDKYVAVLMSASGIEQEDAKTCAYYGASTYWLPDKLRVMPILAIMGPLGTGKSTLLQQLAKMVREPKPVNCESPSVLRDELDDTITALMDEADKIDESLLVKRYAKETSGISYKVPKGDRGWVNVKANIFGATIVCRRTPFVDQATKSRCILIKTKYMPGSYQIRDVSGDDMAEIAKNACLELEASHRIRDNWLPLQAMATSIGDEEWLKYSEQRIKQDTDSLIAAQGFEPEEAVLIALKERMLKDSIVSDVLIADVKFDLRREFDLKLKSSQIRQIATDFGFRLVSTGNYPKIKADQALLEKLLREYKLEI